MHAGTFFAFAFPSTHRIGEICEFVITSFGDATVHVQAPAADIDQTDTIATGTSKRYILTCDLMQVTQGQETKAVTVHSDVDIKVEVVFIDNLAQSAAFLALPVQPHFTQFVTAAYMNTIGPDFFAMVLVIATESDKHVTLYR